MAKSKGGRPSKYKPEYCEDLIAFFDVKHTKKEKHSVIKANGDEGTETIETPNPLPFIQDFARKIRVSRDTLHAWTKEHPEFAEAMDIAKGLQESMLANNALLGHYTPSFSIFAAKNICQWRDKTEQEITGKFEGEIKLITPKERLDGNNPQALSV